MNTGAFGQSGGLFKFYSENVKKRVLYTQIILFPYQLSTPLAFLFTFYSD